MQRNYLKLLEISTDQAETIQGQSELIKTLINESFEKENMIDVLLQDIEGN